MKYIVRVRKKPLLRGFLFLWILAIRYLTGKKNLRFLLKNRAVLISVVELLCKMGVMKKRNSLNINRITHL